jgi:hypothetical protein
MPYTDTSNPFRSVSPQGFLQPPAEAVAIVPSDGADLPRYVRQIIAATSGNVSVVPMRAADETAVVIAITAGLPLDIQVRKVNVTGTTATGLVGMI